MFGLSTSWKTKICKNGIEILDQIEEANVPGIELEFRITADIYNQMEKPLKERNITVLSIHNFFPHPEILPPSKASGDAFLLSSLDIDERKLAAKYGCRSIQFAHDLEAKAVVFHLGKVDIDWEKEKWFDLYDNDLLKTSEGKQFIDKKLEQRLAKRDKNLDAVMFSLEELNEEAIKRDVKIGIENRYYGHQIPDFEEIGLFLQKFEGGNVRYWHDCGHAQTLENFGIAKHEQFFKKYKDKLLGVHLHDCTGYNDHHAPGSGKIDFNMIKKYLSSNIIKIIEVHDKVSLTELRGGIMYLKEKEIL